MSKVKYFVFFLGLTSLSALLFNNCGASHKSENTGNSSLDCSMTKMRSTYENGYWMYLRQNSCNGCHSSKGIAGIPHFADDNLRTAILAFIPLGPQKISAKLEIGHQTFNYQNMKPTLDVLKAEWNEKTNLNGCDDNKITSVQSISFFQEPTVAGSQGTLLSTMAAPQIITWDLSNRAPGVEISASITVQANSAGMPVGYIVSDLKVKSLLTSVKIEKINVLLNDNDYFNTTFKSISEIVTKSDAFQPIAAGGAAAYIEKAAGDLYLNSDQWSLKIETVVSTY